jgi:hypothetical protein
MRTCSVVFEGAGTIRKSEKTGGSRGGWSGFSEKPVMDFGRFGADDFVAVIGVTVAASVRPPGLENLLRVNVNSEFLLELLVADLRLVRDANRLRVVVGKDFVVQLQSRPIYDDAGSSQRKYLEGISGWISRTLSGMLQGKKFEILALPAEE